MAEESRKQFKVGFTRQVSSCKKNDEALDDAELESKSFRANQQLIIYIFICFVITLSWVLGFFEFSFLWVFGLIVLTFVVWMSKVLKLTEQHIRQQEVLIHRKRALRQSETAEWLNFVINRWWVFSSTTLSDLVKRGLDPILGDVKPAFLEHIELSSFTVGEQTPFVKHVHVYEYADSVAGGKQTMSWANIAAPPPGLTAVQQYQIVLEMDVGLQCDDFKMIFTTRLGGKWMGMNLDVALERLSLSGRLQLVVQLDMDMPFPHVACVSCSFTEKPEVWFSVRMMKAVQMMEIPILKSWLHTLVMDGLTQALVDPGKVDIKVESVGPTNEPSKARAKNKAQGVLTVTISGEQAKGSAFVDDVRYCSVRLGEDKQHTSTMAGAGPGSWQETLSFLVYDLGKDKLQIKSKSKILLSTYTLAQFDLPLTNFPFEHKSCVDTVVEEKNPRRQGGSGGGAPVKYDLTLQYTALPSVDQTITMGPADSVCGVLYVCIHSASQLLGLDRNGLSDPYCIIYANGKKMKTTHYVARTRNPSWEVSKEVVVGDFTRTMLSFTVYDWDGSSATDDDFLGSAHLLLNKSEPAVLHRSLTLGYNVLNVGQVDSSKLGTICVSVVFRPVAAVSKSEQNSMPAAGRVRSGSHEATGSSVRRGLFSSAREKDSSTEAQRQKLGTKRPSAGVGDLLSIGEGLLELNIIQAKDLVAMDSNGFSDPYCEVKINNERKFTTSIKKKTLTPVWDEWVTTQLPKTAETLEILVWDKDPFFQKDFLGSVAFTYEDLKRCSRDVNNDGWYQLQRIKSGYIQLHFKVISADADEELAGPVSDGTTDSGVAPSLPSDDPSYKAAADTKQSAAMGTGAPHTGESIQEHPASISKQNGGDVLNQTASSIETSPLSPPARSPPGRRHRGRLHRLFTRLFHRQQTSASVPTARRRSHDSATSDDRKSSHSYSNSLRKRFGLKPRRSASDANIKHKPSRDDDDRGYHTLEKSAGLSGSSSIEWDPNIENYLQLRGFSNVPVSQATSMASLADTEKYFGVQCRLGRVRGLPVSVSSVYCKVRLDNRILEKRSQKFSNGKVIGKTAHVDNTLKAKFDFCFDVDCGRGVAKDALLILDLKTSQKNHVATKGYTVQQLLGDASETNSWVPLEHGVEVELVLSQNNSSPLSKPRRRRRSGSGLFRFRSKSKLT